MVSLRSLSQPTEPSNAYPHIHELVLKNHKRGREFYYRAKIHLVESWKSKNSYHKDKLKNYHITKFKNQNLIVSLDTFPYFSTLRKY